MAAWSALFVMEMQVQKCLGTIVIFGAYLGDMLWLLCNHEHSTACRCCAALYGSRKTRQLLLSIGCSLGVVI